MSSGIGPVSFYSSFSSNTHPAVHKQPRPLPTSADPTTGRVGDYLAAASKAEEGARIASALSRLTRLHQVAFPPVARPTVAPPTVQGQQEILAYHTATALAGTSVWQWKARRVAREAARWAAFKDIDGRYQLAKRQHVKDVSDVQEWWDRLQANDPDTVWEQLARAFADNEAAAAPLAVHDSHGDIAVLLPPVAAIPLRVPGVTAAGNPSLRMMTKTQTAVWYQILTCGFVLTTAKEAFAVAPGLHELTLIALRPQVDIAAGQPAAECILAATITREKLATTNLTTDEPVRALFEATTEVLIHPKGRTGSWEALPLRHEPDLQAILDSVDFEDLAGHANS